MERESIKKKQKSGFTLIELLVVIAIIGILATVIIVSLNSARVKARDAKRASEMEEIFKALYLFYDKYGCLPVTYGSSCPGAGGYLEVNSGGWDYSSQGEFLTFLHTSGIMPNVPVDPVNNMTGDGSPAGTFAYRYYCYSGGSYPGLHLGYWNEATGTYIIKNIPIAGNWSDSSFPCK
jgi:prepilin-type N-terminal cleavage/methylation domain-containing protein